MEGALFCKTMKVASDDPKDVLLLGKEGVHAGCRRHGRKLEVEPWNKIISDTRTKDSS